MRSRLTRSAVLAVTLGVLAGCSDADQADRCAKYEDVAAQAENMRSWQPQTEDVEEMRGRAEELDTELDQLQAVSEGRLDRAISSLRKAIDDFLEIAADQGQKAMEAARPALADAHEEFTEAWSVVEQVAENQCGDA